MRRCEGVRSDLRLTLVGATEPQFLVLSRFAINDMSFAASVDLRVARNPKLSAIFARLMARVR